ncbi:hypothetical protein ACTI_19910 [Actinoplanes sp. OR16]|nr:hypothetical protein ACTI_19910 [Actinoplanes sp. OR16]
MGVRSGVRLKTDINTDDKADVRTDARTVVGGKYENCNRDLLDLRKVVEVPADRLDFCTLALAEF